MSKIYKNASREETRKDASQRQCSYCFSRIICRYSVVSNAMIRKEKVSINLGFPFEMLECGHSELQRPGLILLTSGLLVFYHLVTKIPS